MKVKNKFKNIIETPSVAKGIPINKLLSTLFIKDRDATPKIIIPSIKTDLSALKAEKPSIIWFGHSSYLIKYKELNILVDPVLSGNASPIPKTVKAFKGSDIYKVKDMPTVDYLILTHDHYDHLDIKTLKKISNKLKKVYCPTGVKKTIQKTLKGIEIIELSWWESNSDSTISITATPARHSSGRGIKVAKTLWASYILQLDNYTLYLGGDSGYSPSFKEIGEKFPSIDIAILECGQYHEYWPYIHMMPEEVVQASIDLQAKLVLPVHWSKFSLAPHSWKEPIERFTKEAIKKEITFTTPKIGEVVILGDCHPKEEWWKLK